MSLQNSIQEGCMAKNYKKRTHHIQVAKLVLHLLDSIDSVHQLESEVDRAGSRHVYPENL